jgi:hypothetical protein
MNTSPALPLKIGANGYSGGSGQGFTSNTSPALPLTAGANGYSGGTDDGFSFNIATSLLMSGGANGYTGGNGSGFNSGTSATQSFTTNTMFSGGSDDGFSSQMAIRTYIFIGDGNWNIPTNWYYNTIPPASLPAGSMIQIDPVITGECVLNIAQDILPGATITIMAGKKMRIIGNLILQ